MPSQYLQPSDYLVYGLPTSTTVPQVTQASALIDGYLQRPQGLVYGVDYLSLPCYMAGANPSLTVKSTGSITAGNSVVVAVAPAILAYSDMIGEVVILDRANPSLVEACVISAMTPGQITLSSVANAHSANCTIEFGMTILEERYLPAKRSICRVAYPPLRVLSGMGRYGYGRRTDQTAGMFNEVNLLAVQQVFGGPPMWEPFTVSMASVSIANNEIWIPAGVLLAYFSEVRIRYISGWTQTALPAAIKQACANIINNAVAAASLGGNVKTMKAGSVEVTRFTASMIDVDTRVLLDSYRNVTVI